MSRIIRVFPSRTVATPTDELAYVDRGPGLPIPEADEVHISVSFTWDLPRAEQLKKLWKSVAPVKIGGPATGQRGEEFIPGKYLRPGYTITSRGCPNRCAHCTVWKRDGPVRELPIKVGSNVQDDNLLACSDKHIKAVFRMLKRQTDPVRFGGGLEAKLLQEWHVEELTKLNLLSVFFAYDTPDDHEPLVETGKMLARAGIIKPYTHVAKCYVLIGMPRDDFDLADDRMIQTMQAGFMPYPMLFRGPKDGKEKSHSWKEFRKRWAGNFSMMSTLLEGKRKVLWDSIGWKPRKYVRVKPTKGDLQQAEIEDFWNNL